MTYFQFILDVRQEFQIARTYAYAINSNASITNKHTRKV